MTTPNPDADRQMAARLRAAFAAADSLSCDAAQELLPALVAAEQAGQDVDSDPAFAALLRHLDECDNDCLALYEELSEGIAALDPASPQAAVPPPARVPTFFGQTPDASRSPIRILDGLRRRFTFDIPLPQPLPLVGTLGSSPQVVVFAAPLDELAGKPTLTATLEGRANGAVFRVALPVSDTVTRWQVELRAGTLVTKAFTDERGIATFDLLPLEALRRLEVVCEEVAP